ncbi:MAG TPA: gamma-glutamyl-gamma-aminobutyrate hydrolase family protein [Alphaproteobacteria bacterium]|nr:gamma-glutamyl-gamma-aminobutyrate hydrolase family protein [Alphaproteobacteria bacterium]
MTRETALPLVGLPACIKDLNGVAFHAVGARYLDAVATFVGATPMIVPALGDAHDVAGLALRLDGLMLTGSPSNVEPRRYGGSASAPGTLHDPARDETTLPLIRAAIAAGVPVLAICRGIQEFNVALGGTLHQRVWELAGKMDHRGKGETRDEKYGPRHPVKLARGGYLAELFGAEEVIVNSLHGQAIDRPAPGLEIEALSPDGIIEAVRLKDAPAFALGVQWHPEWKAAENPLSRTLFTAFGDAVRGRAAARARGQSAGIAA